MANPRKFSEKIALHNQKQAEGTAEFEKVMKEVSDVTNKPSIGIEDQLKHAHQHPLGYRDRPHGAVGPIRARTTEKRMEPYNSFLSPPSNSWRRTHSDSSLHTSSHENNSHRRGGINDCQTQNVNDYDQIKRSFSYTTEGRPRSATDMDTRLPGISICPSPQDPGTNQIPIGSNTGSLPDLSSFHMASPLNIPLDDEESPYMNNSHGGSPRSLSPQLMRNQRFTCGSLTNEAPPHHMNHIDRTPRHSPHSRPSPQMSPQLALYSKYDSQSPSSCPQSPPSPSSSVCKMNPSLEQNNFYINQDQVALQQHFEQFSMSEDSCTKLRSHELPADLFCPGGPHQYPPRMTQDPASNTPSSIPDITLTDFSNGGDFELFTSEKFLREGLDPIDIDGLQMLTDPTLIADSATEDHLRHDGL